MRSQWDDVIKIVYIAETVDDEGYPTEGEVKTEEIFATKKSVRSSEFYQAASIGKAVQVVFEIHTFEFVEGAKYIEFNNKRYAIVRDYENGEITEVVCTFGSSIGQGKSG